MKKRYGLCICHDKLRSLNAKGLCSIGSREAREKSAESKGILTKSARNKENIAIFKKKEDVEANKRYLGVHFRHKLPIRGIRQFIDGVARANNKEPKENQVAFKKTKINPVSKDKATEVAILAKIKSKKIRELGKKCEMCEKHGEVDLFHIIGVGDKKHSTNPLNLALSCRFCHLVWGANDWGKIVKFKNFDEIMSRLKSLDEGKYWKIKHKIDEYYAKSNSV